MVDKAKTVRWWHRFRAGAHPWWIVSSLETLATNRPLIRKRASEHAALSKKLTFTPIETRDDKHTWAIGSSRRRVCWTSWSSENELYQFWPNTYIIKLRSRRVSHFYRAYTFTEETLLSSQLSRARHMRVMCMIFELLWWWWLIHIFADDKP
jgi:hypothetical protein